MKIGEFIARLKTTKETVRHYEDLQLLTPIREKSGRVYAEKDVLDFQVIVELKASGMGLKDIQLLFALKRAFGCGHKELVQRTLSHLTDHLRALREEEIAFRRRRLKLSKQLGEVQRALAAVCEGEQ